tara:strand:+ start:5836 stop:7446 length:1611 start_codon:yes stop_codon:yes gene_type:complete
MDIQKYDGIAEKIYVERHGKAPNAKWWEIRNTVRGSLVSFIRLIHPRTMLGAVHEELCEWWTRQDARSHQLVLLPRDHQKSRLVGYRTLWYLVKFPDHRILYISSTANLAEKQLKFVKDMLTSDTFMFYFPEYVNPEEAKREKWTSTEVSLDHPLRKDEAVRDPSIFIAGLTTTITGLHCDVAVLDDVVVNENAYTEDGRQKVRGQYSLLSSIESAGALEWIVGTRYHPKDLYQDTVEMKEDKYDDQGNLVDEVEIYEVFERVVEDRGDGTGQFIWPRQRRTDNKWFGFNIEILAKKRGQYLNKSQFRAQYYNDPNDPDNNWIDFSKFQYYDPKYLTKSGGHWSYQGKRLNIAAAVDFAYSLNARADFTAIVVIGVDSDGCYYVLDIARFKTERISEYYKEIFALYNKWDFRKLRAEITGGQKAIVQELKNSYIRPNGIALSIDEHNPVRSMGSKDERIRAVLEPRYDNMSVWHYRGGNCQLLEEELVLSRPHHDDIKDALAFGIETLTIPSQTSFRKKKNVLPFNSRFGGVAAYG